jgi:intracellular sulfur oxidation DsrE/DsrF family protein
MAESNIVLLHVSSSPEDVESGITAAARVKAALPQAQPVVVVNGAAIVGLLNVAAGDVPQGVSLKACNNALHSHELSAKDLPLGTEVVPSGVVYLAERELAGAHYIRI